MPSLVLKFGGSVLKNAESFPQIAAIIRSRLTESPHLIVVVSAMGERTNELISLAYSIHPDPPKREKDMLISVGERVSMSLLAMALDREGIGAISFTGSQSGIITTDKHTEAEILEVRPHRIQEALALGKVVIVAGFQGVSLSKEITTLGRGGSDTSAVALADALRSERVEFYKDVPGVGAEDPHKDPLTQIFPYLTYEEAEKIAEWAKILHPRAIALARARGIPLEVRSLGSPEVVGTKIGRGACV